LKKERFELHFDPMKKERERKEKMG
jgi:hypothetical protein